MSKYKVLHLLAQGRTGIKMHNVEGVGLLQAWESFCAQAFVCTFQSRKFMGWGSEGVKLCQL